MSEEIHLIESPADASKALVSALADLLEEAVEGGASLGYLYQTPRSVYEKFWQGEIADLSTSTGFILVASLGGSSVGVVQCAFATKETGSHRAEVRKLLVKKTLRGQGIATQLMKALESEALARGRSLLYLDTERNSDADFLYPKLGWSEFGVIPRYAAAPNGVLADCTFYYKELSELI